ncbi:hypothetical protein vBVpaMR16F_132 [Vibrio phage vB_VpaM_R16F]|nr:hypothetical protein vBVpaMR16F_132 [Vibrio phage vB_VpaM_R16F]
MEQSVGTDSYISVNSVFSIDVGKELTIYLKGVDSIRIQLSDTQPANDSTDGWIINTLNSHNQFSNIPAGSKEVWVKAVNNRSKIFVVEGKSASIDSYGAGLDPRVYTGYQGLTIQPFTEANVKNGTQFTISEEIPILTGQTVYRGLKTPSDGNDTLVKTRVINTDGGMRYTPHSDHTGTAVGTDKSNLIVNLNSKSSNVSNCQYYDITSVTSEGPFFDVIRSTSGVGSNRQQGIFSGLGIERVLNQDTEYLLKFENLDNKDIYVVFSVTFYVGLLSPDII